MRSKIPQQLFSAMILSYNCNFAIFGPIHLLHVACMLTIYLIFNLLLCQICYFLAFSCSFLNKIFNIDLNDQFKLDWGLVLGFLCSKSVGIRGGGLYLCFLCSELVQKSGRWACTWFFHVSKPFIFTFTCALTEAFLFLYISFLCAYFNKMRFCTWKRRKKIV